MNVFVSVGTGLSAEQDAFVSAVEARLRAVGFSPCTIGRNTFSSNAPLRAVADLMDRCSGAVVVAVERYWFNEGIERRGGAKERRLSTVSLPTSWNQIEAAMAYSRGMPLLVIVDERLRCDGLLEKGNDWFVHELVVDLKSLNSPAFLGLLDDWRQRVSEHSKTPQLVSDPSKMSIAALLGALSLPQIWGLLGALSILLGGAFSLGTIYKTFGEASEKSEVSNKNQTDATDIKRQR